MKNDAAISSARDPAKTPAYYRAYIARMEEQLDLEISTGNPVAFLTGGDYCIRMGRAAYSAGGPVSDCRAYLKRSAGFQVRYYTEGVKSKLTSLWQIEEYLEGFSAAYLAGDSAEVISSFNRVKPDRMHSWDRALLGALETLLLGRPGTPDEEGTSAAGKIREFASLPGLFDAVERRDMTAFTDSLENYATKSWGPPADRVAKKALSQVHPNHSGKWSFFCAAICSVMGGVPRLSKKALQYVPVELVARDMPHRAA